MRGYLGYHFTILYRLVVICEEGVKYTEKKVVQTKFLLISSAWINWPNLIRNTIIYVNSSDINGWIYYNDSVNFNFFQVIYGNLISNGKDDSYYTEIYFRIELLPTICCLLHRYIWYCNTKFRRNMFSGESDSNQNVIWYLYIKIKFSSRFYRIRYQTCFRNGFNLF